MNVIIKIVSCRLPFDGSPSERFNSDPCLLQLV